VGVDVSSSRLARWGASAYAVVAGALAVASATLLIAHAAAGAGHYPPEWEFTLPLGVVSAFLGEMLLRRRPEQKLGWVVAAIGVTVLLQTAVTVYANYSLFVHRLPATAGVFAVAGLPSGSLVPLLAGLFLIFPTGRLPGRRWRPFVAILLLTFVVGLPGQLGGDPANTDYPQLPNPLQLHSALVQHTSDVVNVAQIFILLASAASVALRWRRSGDTVRRQIKVLLAAAMLWPPVVLVLALGPSSFGDSVWGQLLFAIPVITMVIAVFIAVVRYRLYDIDRVISRTVSYAIVTGVLVGCYVGVVALATRLLPFSSAVGVAASTLAVAALFQPLRRRVQNGVDRRFNRTRYDAARTVEQFAVRLRDQVDPALVHADLLAVTARAVEPSAVSLWVAG
jgi:uncharacterized membrane protein YfcA